MVRRRVAVRLWTYREFQMYTAPGGGEEATRAPDRSAPGASGRTLTRTNAARSRPPPPPQRSMAQTHYPNWTFPANAAVPALPEGWQLLGAADVLPTVGFDRDRVKGLTAVLPLFRHTDGALYAVTTDAQGSLAAVNTAAWSASDYEDEGEAWVALATASVGPATDSAVSFNCFGVDSDYATQIAPVGGVVLRAGDALVSFDGTDMTFQGIDVFDDDNTTEPLHVTVAVRYAAPAVRAFSHADLAAALDARGRVRRAQGYVLDVGFTGRGPRGDVQYFNPGDVITSNQGRMPRFQTMTGEQSVYETFYDNRIIHGRFYEVSTGDDDIFSREVRSARRGAFMGVMAHFNPIGAYRSITGRAAYYFDRYYEEPPADRPIVWLLVVGVALAAFALSAAASATGLARARALAVGGPSAGAVAGAGAGAALLALTGVLCIVFACVRV